MTVKFEKLKKTIIKCNKCPRLVKFRKKISTEKRKQYMNQTYWGKPVTGFGDINGKIMIVGLAPAAHGGTRTGRVFTGDKSSDFLYKCLHNVKIANQSNSDHINDGLKIKNTFITPALKCVPPGDKPTRNELNNCFKYFKNEIENLDTTIEQNKNNKKIEVPVCCEENFALDKSRLEKKLNLSYQEILTKFFDKEYFCYMTGFIAGMPFLGDIDENLRTQRLETPRVKVPQGSVGITEQFANIYTFDSPGGWNIIGNTPLKVFDDSKERDPNLINPGDTIIFKKISRQEYERSNDK